MAGEHKFTFRQENIVLCAHADCSFRVYAAMIKERDTVKVITVCDAAQYSEPHPPCNPYSHEENHAI